MSKKGGLMNTGLRERREQQGKTQQKVADLANIALKSYQRIKKGVRDPAASIAILIAKALKSTVKISLIKSYHDTNKKAREENAGYLNE